MGLEKQICVVSSQKNHLSPGSSEWRCGGGPSPSMGKLKEEEAALCGWSVKGTNVHYRDKAKLQRKKRKRKYASH